MRMYILQRLLFAPHPARGRRRAQWMQHFCAPLRLWTRDRAALQVQKVVRGIAGRKAAAVRRRHYELCVKYVPLLLFYPL